MTERTILASRSLRLLDADDRHDLVNRRRCSDAG
jgi:hypothetical protein